MTIPSSIPSADPVLAAQLRAAVDGLAKPPGSLGRIEEIAVRLGLIQRTLRPTARRARLMVFAGDHGLTAEGVSRYPAAVTLAMVQTFLAGRASANAFAKAVDADVQVIDAGIAQQLPDHPNFVQAAVRRGTRNAAVEPALTEDEVEAALSRGVSIAHDAADVDILIMGEMGIGNTASAALLMHALTQFPLERCVGRGAGQDDAGLAHKLSVLRRAAARAPVTTPLDALREFGGCEIAMMAGAMLGAAFARRAIIVDGFISTAAALFAARYAPSVLDYCFFAHCSAESGHGLMLDALQVRPLLELDMRLGEGTGGLLAVPLLRAAALLLSDVISLEDVLKGVS